MGWVCLSLTVLRMLVHRCCLMVYNRSRRSDQACKAGEDEGSMLARAVAQIPELTVATESSKTRAFPRRSSRLPDELLAFVPRNNLYPNDTARLQGVQPVGCFQTFCYVLPSGLNDGWQAKRKQTAAANVTRGISTYDCLTAQDGFASR